MKNYIGLFYVLLAITGCNNSANNERNDLIKADSFIQINQIDSASNILYSLIHSDSDSIAILANLKRGKIAEYQYNYKRAIDIYKEVSHDFNIDTLYERIGFCFYNLNFLDSANYYFNKSIERKYINLSYYYLGLLSEKNKNMILAKRYYQLSINRNKLKYLSYNNLGVIFYNNNQFDSAKYMLNRSIETNKNWDMPYYNSAVYYADKNNNDSALKMINIALDLNRLNPDYLYEKGEIYSFMNNKDSACFYFNEAIKKGYTKETKIIKQYCK